MNVEDDNFDENSASTELHEMLAEKQSSIMLPDDRADTLKARVMDSLEDVPRSFTELLTIRESEGNWIKIAPGVAMKELYVSKQSHSRSYLLRLQPGSTLPAHQHKADEECIVLEGSATLGDVHVSAGDYHLAPQGVPHGVIYSEGGALLFLRGEIVTGSGWLFNLAKHGIRQLFHR